MLAPWKESYNQPGQLIKKQRPYFADKGLSSQSYGFFSSHQSASSVTQSCLTLCNPMNCIMPGLVYSNSCPVSQWCHPTISSSVIAFSSSLQAFPASGSFPMSQFFASGDQSIGASASASVLPMTIQDWLPLGLTGLMSLQSKGLSRVFSNTIV